MTGNADKPDAHQELPAHEREIIEKEIAKLTKNAVSEALFSVFIAGLIVGPIALARIRRAKRLIEQTGLSKDKLGDLAQARVIAWIGIVIWVVLLIWLHER